MPPPSPPPPAALMEELIEEVLLRFPPDEPGGLFRACLVCKPWCRLISGRRFRCRYREYHRTPPMLGFLYRRLASDGYDVARFVPTSAFSLPLAERRCRFRLFDARHGRVLLKRRPAGVEDIDSAFLEVWDPITEDQRKIPMLRRGSVCCWNAAVVCAAAAGACNHLDCHGGNFLVVFVASRSAETVIWTYSSDAGSWSDPISTQQNDDLVDPFFPSVLVGNALYFNCRSMTRALKYDLELHELSVVGLPPSTSLFGQPVVLRTTVDGRLGLATIHESKLCLWSRKDGAEADAVWTRDRVIELETLLCSNAILTEPVLVAFAERVGVILLRANNALFTVDLKMSKVEVCDEAISICTVAVPYMSFYTPALGGGLGVGGEGPSDGFSSA